MRIRDIIIEDLIDDEIKQEIGDPILPQYRHIDTQQVSLRARALLKQPGYTNAPGHAVKDAIKQLYSKTPNKPEVKKSSDTPDIKGKAQDRTAISKLNKNDSSATAGWDDETHGHLRKNKQGGVIKKAISAINPLSDIDDTDLGTFVKTGIQKGKKIGNKVFGMNKKDK